MAQKEQRRSQREAIFCGATTPPDSRRRNTPPLEGSGPAHGAPGPVQGEPGTAGDDPGTAGDDPGTAGDDPGALVCGGRPGS